MSLSDWTSNESQAGSESEDSGASNSERESTTNGEAIQLIKISQQPAGTQKLELNQSNLDKILKSTEDRPLCVISIIGPPRLGKSLLLNYIKLQLEAKEKGQRNFDLANVTQTLTGFEWNSGMDSVTKGIWVWSRAFLIDTTEKDIAVLLLDTQGIDDETSTPQEINSILGLSFLSSSILIYNVANDISSSTFKPLLPIFKFGVACEHIDDECSEEPPFPKISFLVRDWSNPSQYNYGSQDGKLLLKNKIKTFKGDVKTETINVFRKHKCFGQYEVFLLPNVGQTALQSTFTGCLTGLDSEFISNLKSYINSLLKEENLFVKQVLGVEVTQTDCVNYLQQFVNMFNTSSGLVSGETLFKTRCEILHSNIVEKAMKKYQDVINRKQGTCIYLNRNDLQILHENAEKKAKDLFQRAQKLEDFTKEYEKRLHNELKNAYEVVQSVNESSRKSHLTECIGVAENGYRKTLSDQLVFKENEITIYDDGLIKHISDNAMQTAVQDFIKKFPDEDQKSLRNLKGTLEQVLLSILQPFLATNNDNANKANSILVQKCSKIYQDYDARMKRMIQDFPFVDAPVLSQAHLMNYGVAMETFDNFEKPGDEYRIHQHRKHVETQLNKLYRKYVEEQKLKIVNKMREGSKILEKQATAYTEALRVKAQDISPAEELELVHNQAVINITNKFKEFNPFPETASQHEQLNTRLRDQLRLVFDRVKREELDKKRKHEEKLKKESLRCIDMYKQKMDALRANSEFFEEETLLKAHETCFNNAVSSYDDETANDISDFVDVYRTQLEKTILARYSKMKTENDRTVELVKSKARNWISTCQKEYQEAMKEPIESCEQHEEFKQEHEKMKFQAVKSFNSKWSYNSNGFRGEFITELREEIDATFIELMDMFEFRRNSDNDKFTAVKEEARKYYHEEMATHLRNHHFIKPKILRNSHAKASQSAITRSTARIPLKESKISLLKQALERSFRKYEDENTMKLNWELGVEPAIGIDLGTTYCCVAVFYEGRTIVIRNAEGRNTTPSYVAFNPDGKCSIGQPAKDNSFRNAENTVYDAKRIIGRSMQDEQLQNDMSFWPFSVVNGENGPAIEIYGKEYPPEQISALLLKQLVAQAEKILGVIIRKAVITVPAYFADGQRAATIDAGEMAGLEVLQILDEPTAAALAYKLERFKEDARNVLIFDLGGGTFDISILEMDGGNIKILNKDGDTHLGGEDFDKAMMQYCADEFKRENGIDPFQGKNSTQKQEKDAAKQRLRRLQTYCERAKIELATTISAVISVDAFFGGTHLRVEVTRQKFEDLNAAHFQKTIQIVERSLRQIRLSKAQIDDVILVGGSTRIPKMQQMLTQFFDGKALNYKVNPDEAVACGAAVQAALLNGGQAKGSLDIGVVEDVTPMSLGVEAIVYGVRGAFSAIIPKNTKIPTIHKEAYRTFKDNQENAMIRIYQGESPIAQDNTLLGEFVLNGIPPAPAGKECVDVTMEIDAMGVLNVRAMVKSTRGQQNLKVGEKRTGRMSQRTKQKLLLEVQAAQNLYTFAK